MPRFSTHRRARRLAGVAPFFLSLVALGVVVAPAPAPAYTITLTQPELQAIVATQFPKGYAVEFGEVQLHSPRVVLTPRSSRLGLRVALKIDVTELPDPFTVTGRAFVDGEPAYDPRRHELTLRAPQLREFTADGLPAPYAEMVEAEVAAMVRQELPVIVVYRLDPQRVQGASPLRRLKSVRVEGGKLLLELGQ
ncbi:MAG: hypothetical protein COZ33_08230 [Nitrospirae bacterium CG_4_10_14_3_um_filter_70_108]|nr:MAG: hypothetical protein COZ33_08230 [Nitrospirae bacterium CG_4_10_14_3_um_filter_70_108]